MKKLVKPDWHPQWKLMRVISGHLGWVRAIAVDPSNNVILNSISKFYSTIIHEN
jgi:hypothetical protein